jgi:two-component system chemotaxis sensor kinase CheA
LKGNARSFGLLTLAQAAHDCENGLLQGTVTGAEIFEDLNRLLMDYRSIVTHKLDHQNHGDHIITLPRATWNAAVAVLEKLPQPQRQGLKALYDLVQLSHTQTFQQALAPQLESLPSLARELGRSAPFVHIEDPGIPLQPEGAELINTVFLHLLRDALDHGIESPEERRKAHKPAEGHIWCLLKERADGLEIKVRGDGRGLNLIAIEQKARARGLLDSDNAGTPEQIAEYIFHPGFSTRDAVTAISGRGVGLDVVRAILEEAGGSIRINLGDVTQADAVAFTFILHLPLQCVTPRMSLTA